MSEERFCSACSAAATKLLRCSGCQSTWYCNSECQRAHWKSHRPECKRLKAAKVQANTEAGAAELAANDAMRVVVQTDRIVITRCADPDDSIFMQTQALPGINEWLAAQQMECYCESVGTFAPSQSMFVVAAFAPSQIHALPQPRSEIELSDHTRERGTLESEPFNLFGIRLCVTAAPAMGQVSFGLREVASDPRPPLDAVNGVALIASFYLLSGESGRLVLPPPMSNGFHAGKERENMHMKVWCGVGESDTSVCCSDLNALPLVSQSQLLAAPFEAARPPPARLGDEDLVAVGVLVEQCGTTSTAEEFEALSIQAFLHGPHLRQQPQMAVPAYARSLAAETNGIASVLARTTSTARLEFMEKGRGM